MRRKCGTAFDDRAMSGPRAAPANPQAALSALIAKKERLQEELRLVEKQVFDLETTYLQDSSQVGNVLKGFDGFLSSTKGAGNLKRPRKFQPEDRLFSLSSVTSPVMEEHGTGRDVGMETFNYGRIDGIGQSRSKTAGLQANGPSKPKRGRTQSRDGKRIKQANEQDLDDDDDGDRGSR